MKMGNAPDPLGAAIAVIDAQIAELDAQRQKLIQAGELLRQAHGSPLPAAAAPRSREQIVRELIDVAGERGLSRQEVIRQMSRVCDSPPTSISTMLSRLAAQGHVQSAGGRWVPALRKVA